MGMSNDNHSPASLVRLLDWIQGAFPNGAYIFAGSPSHWRTRDGDCDDDPAFVEVWRRVQNVRGSYAICCGDRATNIAGYQLSPWYVGRFSDAEGADIFRQRMRDDMELLKREDAAYGIHRDYTPVVVSFLPRSRMECHA